MNSFEAALALSAGDPAARQGEVAAATGWAAAEVAAQRPDHAMEILERGIRAVPREPSLLISFGLQATAMGQFAIAQQALDAARTLAPKNTEALYAEARLALEQQHIPDAERDLKEYLLLQPQDASAYFGLGHVYAMEQRYGEAQAAFRRSAALKPQQTESYYQLGQLALQDRRDREAKTFFEKVLARDPRHAGALTGMGELALREKSYAEAEQLLRQAEESDPSYATPHALRGLALAHLGRKDEAEVEIRRGNSQANPPEVGTVPQVAPDPGEAAAPHL